MRPSEQLNFVQNLAQTKPANLHDLMMIKLESIFANLLLAKKQSLVVEYTGNKKLIKKKLKKKEKALLQKVEDSI